MNVLQSTLCLMVLIMAGIDSVTIEAAIIVYTIAFVLFGILMYSERKYYGHPNT